MPNDKKKNHERDAAEYSQDASNSLSYNNTVKLPSRESPSMAHAGSTTSKPSAPHLPQRPSPRPPQRPSQPSSQRPTQLSGQNPGTGNTSDPKPSHKAIRPVPHKPAAVLSSKGPGPDFFANNKMKHKNREKQKNALRVVALGGLGEIGKNMTLLEYGNDIIIIDCGMAFPEDNMPGIDAVIQDYTYVIQNKDRVRGVFITHGHEDHIGGLPYLMRELKCPIYGGRLAIELIRGKLTDKGTGSRGIELKHCMSGDMIIAGNSFAVEFIRVNHSIADAFALAVRTPAGTVIHTGDFKIDYTPIDGEPIDLQRFAQYGTDGVLLLMADSTNVEVPGSSPSERQVGESFQRIFQNAPGRLIVATFSSHVHRMQQIFTAAEKYDRKVALVGRSMLNVFAAANSLGYLEMKPDTLIDINEVDRYRPEQIVILTTGSQAEPMAALTRMAYASHKIVEIHEGDTVILSANRIPGNEKSIYHVINELFRLGATVIYEALADVHVSGHAYRNELLLIHELVKPKYFMPVHGEYRMLFRHAQLANDVGQSWNDIFILNNGDIFECNKEMARISGYINASPVLIDGSGVGDLDNRVLRDRRLLADDGVVAVSLVVEKKGNRLIAPPSVQAIGFVYESESEEIIQECSDKLTLFIAKCNQQNRPLSTAVESGQMRDYLKSLLFERTKRRPMILISVTQL
jgi:ribonuclease J